MRGWGRRRDASIRQALQRCQSYNRMAQKELAEFRERFIPLAMEIPIQEVAELLYYLERAETILAGGEGGGHV
jgi:hypothetical protein